MFDIIIAENWDRNLLINKEPHMHQKPGGKKLLFYKIYFESLLSFFIITFL